MALRLAARSVLPAVRRPVSRAFASDVEKYGHIPTDVEQQAGRFAELPAVARHLARGIERRRSPAQQIGVARTYNTANACNAIAKLSQTRMLSR